MKIFIKASYFDYKNDNVLWGKIYFFNEKKENITFQNQIYDYI